MEFESLDGIAWQTAPANNTAEEGPRFYRCAVAMISCMVVLYMVYSTVCGALAAAQGNV